MELYPSGFLGAAGGFLVWQVLPASWPLIGRLPVSLLAFLVIGFAVLWRLESSEKWLKPWADGKLAFGLILSSISDVTAWTTFGAAWPVWQKLAFGVVSALLLATGVPLLSEREWPFYGVRASGERMSERGMNFLQVGAGAFLAAGFPALLAAFVTPEWPVRVSILVFAILGCFFTGASLTAGHRRTGTYWATSAVVWAIVVLGFEFAVRQQVAPNPIVFGIIWGVVCMIGAEVGMREHLRWKRKIGADNPCPRCGAELVYAGQAYVGSTVAVGAGGYGTRTAGYKSAFNCPKCGFSG